MGLYIYIYRERERERERERGGMTLRKCRFGHLRVECNIVKSKLKQTSIYL